MKRLPDGGSPDSSSVVRGVAGRKNVAHRRMRSVIDEPRVLLLAGALAYHRVTNKLSSFDTLLDQVGGAFVITYGAQLWWRPRPVSPCCMQGDR